MALIGPIETRRLALSLFLGLCVTLLAVNVAGLFHGATITPLLDDTVNLPGTLFANFCGSPPEGERPGLWRAVFFLGALIAYTFFPYSPPIVAFSRTRRRQPSSPSDTRPRAYRSNSK